MNTRNTLLQKLQKNFHLPGNRLLKKTTHSFSKTEKIVFFALLSIFTASTAVLLFKVNNAFLVEIPIKGGIIIEGVVGTTPPKINPVASSPFTSPATENDLIMLIYSGLMKVTPDGNLSPDLAKDHTISEDGLIYTFTLKDNLVWHDGTPLTSEDVQFTIQKAQNPEINSRNKASWDGVNIETPDLKTIIFSLTEPYAPFLQNTTLGIIPKHLWKGVHPENFASSHLNIRPIGSGPYFVEKVKTNKNGIVEYYDLRAFKHYALGEPFIQNVRIKFFSNEEDLIEAYKKGVITNMGSISPDQAILLEEDYRIEKIYLPRIFSAFFNQNEAEIFTRQEVREALDIAIDREKIIKEALFGYATEITGPIPPGSLGYMKKEDTSLVATKNNIEQAQEILESSGWKKGEDGIYTKETESETLRLSFSISTTEEAPELYAIAQILKNTWEKLGAEVESEIFDTKDNLENYAIRPRDYDILLFGEIVGVNADPYAFWHSSQRLDPGLNIASYANITVDDMLEKARTTTDRKERRDHYKTFQEEIQKDIPAIFLYAPQLIYVVHNDVQGTNFFVVNTPSERLANIHTWFIKTEHVWRIFAKGKTTL